MINGKFYSEFQQQKELSNWKLIFFARNYFFNTILNVVPLPRVELLTNIFPL
jgi:hypothetical protein